MRLKFYSDIDEMPVYNWFKINSTQDLSFLLVKRKKLRPSEIKFLSKEFSKVYDQYIAMFGFNEMFLEILIKRLTIAKMQLRAIEKKDRGMATLIKIQEAELAQMVAMQPPTSTFYEIKDYVENKAGFQIDIHRMSVTEFYTKLKTFNNG